MHFLFGPRVPPINKFQVKPGFVMAALLVERRPKGFRKMENAPCLFTFQKRWEPGGLGNPQTSAQCSRMDPQWCGAR